MRNALGWVLTVGLAAQTAQARTVVFVAPPELTALVKRALDENHVEAIDATALDDALFNAEHSAKNEVALGHFAVKPPPLLSSVTKEDWLRGLEGCKARVARSKGSAPQCAEELVDAVWQRYLENVQPERVIEFKVLEHEGDDWSVEIGSYTVSDPSMSVDGTEGEAVDKAIARTVRGLLSGRPMITMGIRPNSNVLPGVTPPLRPAATDGTPQTPSAVKVKIPDACAPAPAIQMLPASAPLSQTITALWKATVEGHVHGKSTMRCSFALNPSQGGHTDLSVACGGGGMFQTELFPGSHFGDSALQAAIARTFVTTELAMECEASQHKK